MARRQTMLRPPAKRGGALRPCVQDGRGAVVAEFSVFGLVFCLLLFGALDLGRYQITAQSLRAVAASAARTALVLAEPNAPSGCAAKPSDSALLASVRTTSATPLLSLSSVGLTSSCAQDANGVRTISVTVTYPFSFVAPVFVTGTQTLSETAKTTF